MRNNALRSVATLGAIGILALALAAPSAAQTYNLSGGDYLTEEEYKELSKDEAMEYCEKLAQEIDIQNDNAAAANSMLSDIDAEIAKLREELARAKEANSPLAQQVADLEAKLRQLNELPQSYTVIKDDWLIKISKKRQIYGDGTKWRRIYNANTDKIKDPNLIYPNQVFMIPR
jgi:nucleoid-associated protein YgaU